MLRRHLLAPCALVLHHDLLLAHAAFIYLLTHTLQPFSFNSRPPTWRAGALCMPNIIPARTGRTGDLLHAACFQAAQRRALAPLCCGDALCCCCGATPSVCSLSSERGAFAYAYSGSLVYRGRDCRWRRVAARLVLLWIVHILCLPRVPCLSAAGQRFSVLLRTIIRCAITSGRGDGSCCPGRRRRQWTNRQRLQRNGGGGRDICASKPKTRANGAAAAGALRSPATVCIGGIGRRSDGACGRARHYLLSRPLHYVALSSKGREHVMQVPDRPRVRT